MFILIHICEKLIRLAFFRPIHARSAEKLCNYSKSRTTAQNPCNQPFRLKFLWKNKTQTAQSFSSKHPQSFNEKIIFYFHLFRLLLTALSINQSKTDYFQTQTTFYSKALETTQKLNLFLTSSNRKSMKLFTFFPFRFYRQFFISFFSFPIFFGVSFSDKN